MDSYAHAHAQSIGICTMHTVGFSFGVRTVWMRINDELGLFGEVVLPPFLFVCVIRYLCIEINGH